MFRVQFSTLLSLIYSLGFVINRESIREALGPTFPLAIPLAEMGEIIESFIFRNGKRKHILFTRGHTIQGKTRIKNKICVHTTQLAFCEG